MFSKYIGFITICLTAMACTKEMAEYPYTELVQFSIADVQGSSLKGVVENDEIIIYWPPYLAVPDSISPVITVAEKATILPASGSKVAMKSTTIYTVTAENGSQKTYRLKPVINQPIPYIRQITEPYAYFGAEMVIGGDFFLADSNLTKVYLLGSDGKETKLHYWAPYENIALCNQTQLWLQMPQAIKDTIAPISMEDEYFVKIVTGSRTIISETKVKPVFNVPYFITTQPASIKAGQVVTLTAMEGRPLVGIKGITLMDYGERRQPVEIVSYNKSELRIRIPANTLTGEFVFMEVKSASYGGESQICWMETSLTVAP